MKTIKDNVIESCTHWIEECKMNKVPTPTKRFYEDVITILRGVDSEPVTTINAELLEASKDFVERVNKNIYPKPDKPKSDWAILQNLIAAIKQAEQS